MSASALQDYLDEEQDLALARGYSTGLVAAIAELAARLAEAEATIARLSAILAPCPRTGGPHAFEGRRCGGCGVDGYTGEVSP